MWSRFCFLQFYLLKSLSAASDNRQLHPPQKITVRDIWVDNDQSLCYVKNHTWSQNSLTNINEGGEKKVFLFLETWIILNTCASRRFVYWCPHCNRKYNKESSIFLPSLRLNSYSVVKQDCAHMNTLFAFVMCNKNRGMGPFNFLILEGE